MSGSANTPVIQQADQTILSPSLTTASDLCYSALQESGAIGDGQTPTTAALTDALARLQWMLQQWERQRWKVYHLVDLAVVSTGKLSYSIGPGGDINTSPAMANPFNNQFNSQFGAGNPMFTSARPARIESSFLRQLTQSQPNQIDYPMQLLQSREDYNRIALKSLVSFPGYLFYDSAWPLGQLYPWPVPQANIYELHVSVIEQLPVSFPSSTTAVSLPYEYYLAIVYNLAIRLRPKYGIASFPGDVLPGLAKDSLKVLRGANVQIARLVQPTDLIRAREYNIFSDRMY